MYISCTNSRKANKFTEITNCELNSRFICFFFLFSFFLNGYNYNKKHSTIKVIPKSPKKLKTLGSKPRTMTVALMYKVVSRNNPLQNIFPFSGKNFTLLIFILPRTLFNVFSGHILRNGPNLQT